MDAEKEWLRRMKKQCDTKENSYKEETIENPICNDILEVNGKGLEEVAGMNSLKQLITEGFINILKHQECASAYGIKPPALLFYGPAGCGKTFFAEKMAEEIGINFMKIVPDDIACTWIHGTQQKIGELFRKAEKNGPTLIFFDEFEAMVPHRSSNEANQHQNGEVNEFLCMLNNAADRGIYVVAATNFPERIDKAILRTGRIDEIIYVDMPDAESREALFKLELKKLPVEEDIDFMQLATLTDGYNCSDINYIIKTASRKMFNETIKDEKQSYKKITQKVLEETISQRPPSITERMLREYERIRNEFSPNNMKRKETRIGFH